MGTANTQRNTYARAHAGMGRQKRVNGCKLGVGKKGMVKRERSTGKEV